MAKKARTSDRTRTRASARARAADQTPSADVPTVDPEDVPTTPVSDEEMRNSVGVLTARDRRRLEAARTEPIDDPPTRGRTKPVWRGRSADDDEARPATGASVTTGAASVPDADTIPPT